MKKFVALLCVLFLSCSFIFADESADEYDDGYVYETNGKGDQLLKIAIMPVIPLNFGDKLKTGIAAELGLYRFISNEVALGGEICASFSPTIGKNALTMIPITFGVLYQPTFGSIEVPISVGAGIGYETVQNVSYFPSLVVNAEAGVFYRFSEMWSLGGEGKIFWIPQWVNDSSLNRNKLFVGAVVCARYHF